MVQKDAGISLTLCIAYCMKGEGVSGGSEGAGISLLCVSVTYCRKEEGIPGGSEGCRNITHGRAEGCRNITPLCVRYLLQEGGGFTW